MKRLSLILLAVGFGVGLLVVSLMAETKAARVLAAEDATMSAQVFDYYLPYPGVLPDHPLYWLKMIRDKLLLVVTRNPVDKYERLLLYADKRINAAKFLAEGNQLELAVATATKAEKYLEQARQQTEKGENLEKAYRKHLEVLEEIRQRVSGAGKLTIEQMVELTKHGLEKVKDL